MRSLLRLRTPRLLHGLVEPLERRLRLRSRALRRRSRFGAGRFRRRLLRGGGSVRLGLSVDHLLEMLADFRREVAGDAALPDLGGLDHFAGDDRSVGQELLAGLAVVECGDRVELRLGKDLCVDECGLLLEIGASAGQLERLLVDGRDDQFLQVRILLDQLLLQRCGCGRQDDVVVVGGADRIDRRARRLEMRFGRFPARMTAMRRRRRPMPPVRLKLGERGGPKS